MLEPTLEMFAELPIDSPSVASVAYRSLPSLRSRIRQLFEAVRPPRTNRFWGGPMKSTCVGLRLFLVVVLGCLLPVFASPLEAQVLGPARSNANQAPSAGEPACGWVRRNPYPSAAILWGIATLDEERAVIVGGLGAVVRTTDGGESWTEQRVDGVDRFTDVTVAEGDTLFAIGSPSGIFRSDDAGVSWTQQQVPAPRPRNLNRVAFVDANHGWIAATGVILHTEDGGATWIAQQVPESFEMGAVVFVDQKNGMASGGCWVSGSLIARTTDGGANWRIVYRDPRRSSSVTIWAGFDPERWLGQSSSVVLLHTDNGGTTWRTTPSPAYNAGDLRFADASRGMLVDSSAAFITEDQGETWSPLPRLPSVAQRFSWANRDTATLIGRRVPIVRTDNAGQTWRAQSVGFDELLNGVFMLGPTTAVVVGQNCFAAPPCLPVLGGLLARTDDGGRTWTSQRSDVAVLGVWFIDELRGFAVRYGQGSIIRTDDGGFSWEALNVWSGPLRAISFADDQHGFAVGGPILRTDDGGLTWTRQMASPRGEFFAVSMLDADRATVVGDDGKIFQTADGGATWVQRESGTNGWLTGVSFGDASSGIVVGRDGLILRTVDGGETWEARPSGVTANLQAVQFASPEVAFIVGGGVALRTADGGETWSVQDPGPNYLVGLSVFDENVGMAVGYGGAVLITTGGEGCR